jgi:hypothetical protein
MADRLISIPTGSKIPYRVFRAEVMFERSRSRSVESFLGIGVGKSFDMELRSERFESDKTLGTFDLGYNYIAPIQGFGPGLSVGVQDVLDRTRDGRRAYFAATFLEGSSSEMIGDKPLTLTIGAYFGSINAAFVGVDVPFTNAIHMLAEQNGRRITFGIESQPVRWAAVRILFRERDTLLSAALTRRF